MNEYLKNLGKVSVTGEGEWSNTKEFERLSIVYKINSDKTVESFLSRKFVPSGIDIYNKEYWQPLALTLKGSGSDSGGDTPTPTPTPDTYYTINVTTNIATGVITINGIQKTSGSYKAGTRITIIVVDSEGKYLTKTKEHIVSKDETVNIQFTNDDIINTEEYYYVKINSINVNDTDIVIKVGSKTTYVGNVVSVLKGQTVNVTAVDPNGRYETYNHGPITNDAIIDIEMVPISTSGVTYEMIAKSWTYNNNSKNTDCITLYKLIGQHYKTGYETIVSDTILEEYSPIKINDANKGAASFYSKNMILQEAGKIGSIFYNINQLTTNNEFIFKVADNLNDDDIIIVHIYAFSAKDTQSININCLEESSNKQFTISFNIPYTGPNSNIEPSVTYNVTLGTVKFADVNLTSDELSKLNIGITAINNSPLSVPKNIKGSSQKVDNNSYIEVTVTPLTGSEFKEHKFYYTITNNTTVNLELTEKQPGAVTTTKVYLGKLAAAFNGVRLTKGVDWNKVYFNYVDRNNFTRYELPENEANAIEMNIGERIEVLVECSNNSNYRADDYTYNLTRAYRDSSAVYPYIIIENNMKGFTAYLKPTSISIELEQTDEDYGGGGSDEEDEIVEASDQIVEGNE